MKYRILAAAAASCIAGSAIAGAYEPAPVERVVVAPAPVAPVTPDWTGFYAGAQGGYGFGDAEIFGDEVDHDGFVGGVHAGYNHDFGRFVLGGEADLNYANLEVDEGLDFPEAKIDQLHRLKLKAGWDTGRALVYGTAAAAYANLDASDDDLSDWGWGVGAGVDVMVRRNISTGIEYMYHEFDDFDDTGLDVDIHTVQARVSYHF